MTSHSILVLGATGPTGRHIVTQALDRGHTVTVLARRLERLDVRHPRLTAVAADVATAVLACVDDSSSIHKRYIVAS